LLAALATLHAVRRVRWTALVVRAAAVAALAWPAVAGAATPAVTLTSPTSGALFTGGQPTFAGAASTASDAVQKVTVRVYAGSTATGTAVRTLTATPSAGGGYSVQPSPGLPDWVYTAQSEQDDIAGDRGFSAAVSFVVHDAPSSITLDSLGSKPLVTATPTLTGVAATAAGDASQVTVLVYAGTTTTGALVESAAGAIGPGGRYSVRVTPGLADGRYTAIADQAGTVGSAVSQARTFRIKVNSPAVRLVYPAAGQRELGPRPAFSGAAGTELGDSPTVTVRLYRGSGARHHPIGSARFTATDGAWAGSWPRAVSLGRYTVEAEQSDDAGHTTVTAPRTFVLVPAPRTVGAAVTLGPGGLVSVQISCTAQAGAVCTGSVLILTEQRTFQPVSGGPEGQLRVLFAYVSIPAGQMAVVRRSVSGPVARALRLAAPLEVLVTASLAPSGSTTVVRPLRLS
jgi:Big-like domain-containing protein